MISYSLQQGSMDDFLCYTCFAPDSDQCALSLMVWYFLLGLSDMLEQSLDMH